MPPAYHCCWTLRPSPKHSALLVSLSGIGSAVDSGTAYSLTLLRPVFLCCAITSVDIIRTACSVPRQGLVVPARALQDLSHSLAWACFWCIRRACCSGRVISLLLRSGFDLMCEMCEMLLVPYLQKRSLVVARTPTLFPLWLCMGFEEEESSFRLVKCPTVSMWAVAVGSCLCIAWGPVFDDCRNGTCLNRGVQLMSLAHMLSLYLSV